METSSGNMRRFWDLRTYGISGPEIAACLGAGAVAGAVLGFHSGLAAGVSAAYLAAAMLMVTVTDSRRMLIPDVLSLPSIAVGLAATAALAVEPAAALVAHGVTATASAAVLLILRWAYGRWRGVEGLGLGDIKLAATAGAWTGPADLPMVILLASLSALLLVLSRHIALAKAPPQRQQAIPFGSFLAPALMVVWVFRLSTG